MQADLSLFMSKCHIVGITCHSSYGLRKWEHPLYNFYNEKKAVKTIVRVIIVNHLSQNIFKAILTQGP